MSHMVTLTPIGGYGSVGNMGMSALKSMSFFLLFAGIVLVAIGYIQQEKINVPPRVEYRYIPRSFEEQQSVDTPILSVFGQMFSDRDPLSRQNGFVDTYPWQQFMINSRVVLPYQGITGFGRAVGDRVIG